MMKIVLLILVLIMTYQLDAYILESIEIPTRVTEQGKQNLAADIYLSDSTTPKPVILIQTPYDKSKFRLSFQFPNQTRQQLPIDFDNYNYVVVDWRGFYDSKEAAIAGYDRGLDGYDIIEWIALQKWSNGKIATWGASALGAIQYQTARHNPPHLICCVPHVKDFKNLYSNYYYGGALRREHVESLVKLGFMPDISIITNHPSYDNNWKIAEKLTDYPESFSVPMLLVGGWYDHFPSDVIRAFHDLRTRSDESVREQHRLIMGPWLHGDVGVSKQGVLTYQNSEDFAKYETGRFFDYLLLEKNNDWPKTPVIQYYQMGENLWKECNDWYSLQNASDTLYLHPQGLLSFEPMPETFKEVPPDTIIYNPKAPTPSFGGERFDPFDTKMLVGPQDLSDTIETRNDVLVYSTSILDKEVILTGSLKIELFVGSDAPDTDFGVRLTDVYPDGRSIIIRQGIKRMRFRDSYENEVFMNPGEVYTAKIEIDDLAYTFLKGHRLRIVISSANYSHYDINPNSGGILYQPGDTITATNLVYHDSRVIIPYFDFGTSVTQIQDDENIILFPQPATDYAQLLIPENMPIPDKVEIFDIFGKKLMKVIPASKIVQVDTENLTNGTYYLLIHYGDNLFGKPMIVVR
jgi:uncharacterized protein